MSEICKLCKHLIGFKIYQTRLYNTQLTQCKWGIKESDSDLIIEQCDAFEEKPKDNSKLSEISKKELLSDIEPRYCGCGDKLGSNKPFGKCKKCMKKIADCKHEEKAECNGQRYCKKCYYVFR